MSTTKLNRIRISIISIMTALHFRKSDDNLPKSVGRSDQPVKLDFEYCLRPIYYTSRVSGLLPFSIARDSNGDIHAPRINIFDFVFFILSISWYLFLTYTSFRDIQHWPSLNNSHVLTVSNYSLLIMGLIFGAITITMDMSNRTRLVDILKKFITFDRNVENFGVQFDYKHDRRCIHLYYAVKTSVAVLLTITTIIIYTSVRANYSTLNILNYLGPHIFQYVIMFNISTTYLTLIRCLRQRFIALNSLLRKQFPIENVSHELSSEYKNESLKFIKYIGQQHSFLTDIMNLINVCYSFQIMVSCGATFILGVLTCYTFYRHMCEQTEFFKDLSAIHIVWITFFCVLMLIVIHFGSVLAREGRRTSDVAHDIMNFCNDRDISMTLGHLSQQVQNRSPILSCGLFEFDWTLVYTILGATTTYVVILVQLDTKHLTPTEYPHPRP